MLEDLLVCVTLGRVLACSASAATSWRLEAPAFNTGGAWTTSLGTAADDAPTSPVQDPLHGSLLCFDAETDRNSVLVPSDPLPDD
jgi:hypothetical protein